MGEPRARRKPAPELRKRPRQARAQATFDAILEAAARILEERGASALTTNRVAERAGVSVGSLYQYFSGARGVLRALAERELARAVASRPALLDDVGAALADRLRAVVDWRFDVHAARPRLARELEALLPRAISPAERERFLAVRLAGVRRLLASAGVPARELDRRAFVVETCLDALASAAVVRRPAWLADAALRAEVAAMLARALAAPDDDDGAARRSASPKPPR
jgi:AcrR family transcriptional regulator